MGKSQTFEYFAKMEPGKHGWNETWLYSIRGHRELEPSAVFNPTSYGYSSLSHKDFTMHTGRTRRSADPLKRTKKWWLYPGRYFQCECREGKCQLNMLIMGKDGVAEVFPLTRPPEWLKKILPEKHMRRTEQ